MIIAQPCPSCGRSIECATSVGAEPDAEPGPGDVTVCFYCAAAMQWGEDMKLAPVDWKTLPLGLAMKLIAVQRFVADRLPKAEPHR